MPKSVILSGIQWSPRSVTASYGTYNSKIGLRLATTGNGNILAPKEALLSLDLRWLDKQTIFILVSCCDRWRVGGTL